MTTKAKIAFLKKLKEEINKSTEFICNYPTDENIGIFIWVEKKDSMMGDDECHYEVIFNEPKDGNPDVASVEVHFENPETLGHFQGIELHESLMYADWEGRKDSRIVYRDRDEDNNSNEDIIERLRKLEQLIGADLRDAVWKKIPAAAQEMYRELLAFQRVPGLAQKAIQNAGNKCELDPSHKSFTGKNGKNYMEGHHLIPLAEQGNFQNSLNQAANMVCLCPNCHKEIHYGANRQTLVKTLWTQRQAGLKSAGINVTLKNLQSYY